MTTENEQNSAPMKRKWARFYFNSRTYIMFGYIEKKDGAREKREITNIVYRGQQILHILRYMDEYFHGHMRDMDDMLDDAIQDKKEFLKSQYEIEKDTPEKDKKEEEEKGD